MQATVRHDARSAYAGHKGRVVGVVRGRGRSRRVWVKLVFDWGPLKDRPSAFESTEIVEDVSPERYSRFK